MLHHSDPSGHSTRPQALRRVPIWERSVCIGDLVVIDGHRAQRALLASRLRQGGYQIEETPHFLLGRRQEAPSILLIHQFSPEQLDADLKHHLVVELRPTGLLDRSSRFGEVLAGIVASFYPQEVRRAWRFFGANTLQRLLVYLSTVLPPPPPPYTTLGCASIQYQRVCELCVGTSFLDAGCESGFLPLLVAERQPFLRRVVGLDLRPDLFPVVEELARERGLWMVSYVQADLREPSVLQVGTFDTVVALGVLEHFGEQEMYQVVQHLLTMTRQRLIVMVPYEQEPDPLYEHQQVFTRAKLEVLGAWCLQQLGGAGRLWCEDCVGGLLLVERTEPGS
jgi:SAM-dependent methyltransferase